MVGKGQKRRERNFQAAHGGNNVLPPPPKLEDVEALPSKLRKILAFKNPAFLLKGPRIGKGKVDGNAKRKDSNSGEKVSVENEISGIDSFKNKKSDVNKDTEPDGRKGSKRKRKRKEGKDLRFQELDLAAPLSKKKKRKEFLDAKKKENKKAVQQAIPEFPGRETIQFGDVVEAPPKILAPKVPKSTLGTYEERQRLNAERIRMETIDAYRKHKGWTSRPGMRLSNQE